MFLPFSQADASTARRFGGTGLGLAISRTLAEGMGGRIELASEVAKGSTFTLWLPYAPAGESSAPANAADAVPLERDEFLGARVLVAEDNAINREVIGQLLRHAGIEVTQAGNGREALQLLERSRATLDLIIMDVQMPEMDGLTATRILRGEACHLPIVALSAGVSAAERDACQSAGMSDFLAKPVDVGDLAAVLTRWLPPRKAPAAAQTAPPSRAAAPDTDFPGLSLEDALPRFLGRRELLAWARDTLVDRHRDSPAHLLEFAATGQWQEMARMVHSLRGEAGNIGANDLAARARALEEELKTADASRMVPMIESMRAAIEKLLPTASSRS